jgi:hypothetical protein
MALRTQGVGSQFTQVVVVFDDDDAQMGRHSSNTTWVSVGW